MLKYPSLHLVFNRKHTATKQSTAPVELHISFKCQRKYYTTGVKLYSGQWHPLNMVIKRTDAPELNTRINHILERYNNFINSLIKEKREFRFDEFEKELKSDNLDGNFLSFYENTLENRNIRPNTRRGQRKTLNALRQYGLIKTFHDITKTQILDFDCWLRKTRIISQAGIFEYHKHLRAYINFAIKSDFMTENPYSKLSFSRGEVDKIRFLEEEDVLMIKNLSLQEGHLIRVRDLFLFQCYTGLAYADLCSFDFSKVESKRKEDGLVQYILKDSRIKTGVKYTIVFQSPAVEILKKYDFKLPIISNVNYNKYLKSIGKMLDLPITLTTHVGRHTFATLCLNKGIRIETVSKMLGHTNIRTTQKYARILDRTVIEAYDILEQHIKK